MTAHIRSKHLLCNNQQGYPPLFALLCQQWTKEVLLEGNDFTRPRHNSQQDLMAHQKVWPHVPFHLREKHRTSKPTEATISSLWDQLAKLDYFSPMLWRIDVYGNLLYRYADAGSLLSWKVDYHFPIERGGLSKPANMRIIQYDAHINKADKLEFVLSRELVCTGLSLFDFRQAVAQHTMESLLNIYATQQHAVPLQLMPPPQSSFDRQHSRRSRESVPSISSQGQALKATRVAHAAAGRSTRLSLGSRPSGTYSLHSQATRDGLPTKIASSPQFSVQADQAGGADPYYHVMEAMSQASVPQRHSESSYRRLSQSSRHSAAPLHYSEPVPQHVNGQAAPYYHVTEPMSHALPPMRHSSSTQRLSMQSSRHSNSHAKVSEAMLQHQVPPRHSSSSHRQTSTGSRHTQHAQHAQQPQAASQYGSPWDHSSDQNHANLAALSELYQPSSPPRAPPPHPAQRPPQHPLHLPTQQQHIDRKIPSVHKRQQPQQQTLARVPVSQPGMPAASAAYMSGFQNGFQTGFQHGSIPTLQQYHAVSGSSGAALEPPALFLEDSSSGELDGYTMMDTTFEQAQAWQSSLLQVTELPPSEQGDEARSVASFELDHAMHALPGAAQHAEDAVSQTSGRGTWPKAQHAVRAFEHAVPAELGPAGMLPPEHESGTSPHDWLKLPEEAQEEEHQQAHSIPDSPRTIDDWLSLQQSDYLADGRKFSSEWTGFENNQALHHAASSTPSITPASSFGSVPGQWFQANRQQQDDATSQAESSRQVSLPSEALFNRLQELNQASPTGQANQTPAAGQAAVHAEAQPPSSLQQAASRQFESSQTAFRTPASATPFARWSSTPILGPWSQAGQPHSTAGTAGVSEQAQHAEQAQQLFEVNDQQQQHSQDAADTSAHAQHAQQLHGTPATQQHRQHTTDLPPPPVPVTDSAEQAGFTHSPSQQPVLMQQPAQNSNVDNSLMLTFAPAGSEDLSSLDRQLSAEKVSPSSSREMADSPDGAASSQASEWGAFGPHPIRQVAVPTRRTLTFDSPTPEQPHYLNTLQFQHWSQHHTQHQPEQQPHSDFLAELTPQPDSQSRPQTESQSEQQAHTGSQRHVQLLDSGHVMEPQLQPKPVTQVEFEHELLFEPHPESGALSVTQFKQVATSEAEHKNVAEALLNDESPDQPSEAVGLHQRDNRAPALPLLTTATAGSTSADSSSPEASADASHAAAVATAEEDQAAVAATAESSFATADATSSAALLPSYAAESVTPSFDPSREDTTLSSSAPPTAATPATAAEPETPSGRDTALKGPALPFAPEWSHSTVGSSSARTADTAGSHHEAAASTEHVAEAQPETCQLQPDSARVVDTSHAEAERLTEADTAGEVATEAEEEVDQGLSRTGSTAHSSAPSHRAASNSPFEGLAAVASLLASAVGKLSTAATDTSAATDSDVVTDSVTDAHTDTDPADLSEVPTGAADDMQDHCVSSSAPNNRQEGNDAVLPEGLSKSSQQSVAQEGRDRHPAHLLQSDGGSTGWTHKPPSASWATPQPTESFTGAAVTPSAAAAPSGAVAAATDRPSPSSQAMTDMATAQIAASDHLFESEQASDIDPVQLNMPAAAVSDAHRVSADTLAASPQQHTPRAAPLSSPTPLPRETAFAESITDPPSTSAHSSPTLLAPTQNPSCVTRPLSTAQHSTAQHLAVTPVATQTNEKACAPGQAASHAPSQVRSVGVGTVAATKPRTSSTGSAASLGRSSSTVTIGPVIQPASSSSALGAVSAAKSENSNSGSMKHAPLWAAQGHQARAEAMRTLAERVRGMAAQLDALKKIELPATSPTSSPRRLNRAATFSAQTQSSPITSSMAKSGAISSSPSDGNSPQGQSSTGPHGQSIPMTPSIAQDRAVAGSPSPDSGSAATVALGRAVPSSAPNSPRVANAVQRINRATSDVSLSSQHH